MAKHQLRGWRSNALPSLPVVSDRARSAPAGGSARSQLFPISAGRTPGDSLLPQNLERRRQCGTGTESRTGRGRWEGRAPRRLGPVGTHPAAGHELHPDLTNRGKGSEAARKLGEEQETLAKENRKWRAERSVAPEPLAAGGRARCPYQASSRSPPPPRRPPRLPPGSALAWSGRLARPWPLLLFLFLVPGRASGSEEPGEGVPGGAAPPTAARHIPGAAAGPGPSAGNGRDAVLRPEPGVAGPGEGRTDSAPAASAAQFIPGGRSAGATRSPRGCCSRGAPAPPTAPD